MIENIIPEKQGDLFAGVYEYKPNTCLVCGKPLPKDKSNNRKYCSTMCRRMADRTPERLKHITDRNNRMQTIKGLVYRAYDYKCAICGWQLADHLVKGASGRLYSNGCEIHHIVPVSKGGNDSDDNLILLCPNCHKEANEGLIEPERLKAITRPLPVAKSAHDSDLMEKFLDGELHEYKLSRGITVIGIVAAHNKEEAILILNNGQKHNERWKKQILQYEDNWEFAKYEDGSYASPDVPELQKEASND